MNIEQIQQQIDQTDNQSDNHNQQSTIKIVVYRGLENVSEIIQNGHSSVITISFNSIVDLVNMKMQK